MGMGWEVVRGVREREEGGGGGGKGRMGEVEKR